MVRLKRIYGDRAGSFRTIFALKSRLNKPPIQRQSKWLNHSAVPAVLEEALRISSTDCRDRPPYRLHQSLASPGLGFAEVIFNLGKSFLYGIEVWRVLPSWPASSNA